MGLSVKILIVDDQRFNLDLLSYILQDYGYEFVEAENGQQALELYQADEDIELILMDVTMPVMDGYDATRAIKAYDLKRFTPIIFVTALDDEETLARCLDAGGDDFIGKPINENVLLAKLKAHSRTVDFHRELNEKNKQLRYHRQLMDREHAIVEHVFQNGMKRLDMDCDNITFHVSPMSMFNGDLFLAAPSPSGGVYLMLGDFTGHGLSAAIGCLPVSDIFYAMSAKQVGVAEIASEMNRRLQELLPSNMFLCACIIEMNHAGDRLSIWSGGMNDLLLLSPEGDKLEKVEAMHMPLGILDEKEFERDVRILKPALGSRLYAYTDGIIESHSPTGEMFGEERLEKLFDVPVENRVEQLFKAVEDFTEGSDQDDDISAFELVCSAVSHRDSDSQTADVVSNIRQLLTLPWQINLSLKAEHMRAVEVVPQLLQVITNIQGLSRHQDLLFTVLSELYSNALEHGLLQLDSSKKVDAEGFSEYYRDRSERLSELGTGSIDFQLRVNPGTEGEPTKLLMSFTDSGDGFDYKARVVDSLESGESFGRGMSLVESLCESIRYSDQGRRVEVSYLLA